MSVQTLELPAELVTVVTVDHGAVKLNTKQVLVPIDSDGDPIVRRVEMDRFNNLTVLIDERSFQRFNASSWAHVTTEPRVVFEAVKDAS